MATNTATRNDRIELRTTKEEKRLLAAILLGLASFHTAHSHYVTADAATGRIVGFDIKPDKPASTWIWGAAAARVRALDGLERSARVEAIEYDPNRSARIALIVYADGEKRYILAPDGLKQGDTVVSSKNADIRPGNSLPLSEIPNGTMIHNVELRPGKGDDRDGERAAPFHQVVDADTIKASADPADFNEFLQLYPQSDFGRAAVERFQLLTQWPNLDATRRYDLLNVGWILTAADAEEPPELPEIAEPEINRHFNRISKRNFDLDTGFYPLGSCTMKHNPKLHERVAALPGNARLHPLQSAARASRDDSTLKRETQCAFASSSWRLRSSWSGARPPHAVARRSRGAPCRRSPPSSGRRSLRVGSRPAGHWTAHSRRRWWRCPRVWRRVR